MIKILNSSFFKKLEIKANTTMYEFYNELSKNFKTLYKFSIHKFCMQTKKKWCMVTLKIILHFFANLLQSIYDLSFLILLPIIFPFFFFCYTKWPFSLLCFYFDNNNTFSLKEWNFAWIAYFATLQLEKKKHVHNFLK